MSATEQREAARKGGASKRGEVVDHPAVVGARTATPARAKARHWFTIVSFALLVVAPALASTAYLYLRAADQYASRVSFSIRSAEGAPPVEFLGALTRSFSGSAAGDAEVVYEFVRSQQMVETLMERLPFREMYNRPQGDVVFRLGEETPIEDIVSYWRWMTDIAFDGGSGLVSFESRAFTAEDANAVTTVVLDASSRLVNELSQQARDDAVQLAESTLAEAEARLRDVRRELRSFREIEQQLDPEASGRAALGLVARLEDQLADTQVELETQLQLVGPEAPRIPYLRQRIESLRQRIANERSRVGETPGDDGGRALADLVAEYEELSMEREFAQNAYLSALASFEQAQIEARRQMRYLAPHIAPTRAETAEYPQRALLALGVFLVLTVAWLVGALILYNIRDRR